MLYIIATPLGHYGDITIRGREILASCDFVIGEEFRPTSTLLKKIGLEQKEIYELNEHTRDKDLAELVDLCRNHKVAFVSDCGTPNFCDPGFQLISKLRREKIPLQALPGPSSLALIISLSSEKIDSFVFEGFLPAEREKRGQKLQNLAQEKRPIVLLETPYRIGKLLAELAEVMPQRRALLGLDLTLETEKVEEASLKKLSETFSTSTKAEPVLLIY
jgi:16S rRNA (cytidine1402-2'-O)-methyltransferase